ncbi:MAG TPA: hypothetical protein VIC08_03600 [Cellvibrionaceae bacterium]
MALLFKTPLADLDGHKVFTQKTLHMTEQLLRASQPVLAANIAQSITQCPKSPSSSASFTYPELTRVLDAITIIQIIGALTYLGRSWLAEPAAHSGTFSPLKALLNEWIELGEWVLQCSDGAEL